MTRAIRVNRVTFCPGQVGLTRFIRHPGLTRILHCITCIDDGVWPWRRWKCISHFCSRCFESSHWWGLYLEHSSNFESSWSRPPFRVGRRETRIVFYPVNTKWRLAVFGVAPCCVCKAYFTKESELPLTSVSLFNRVISGSNPGLTRITIRVSGSSGSVVLTRFQPCTVFSVL